MLKVLYVNGCSHSCGAEMSKPNHYRLQYDLDNSFGGVIARRHGLIHHNDACPGGSNNVMQTTTVQSIMKLLQTYDPSEIFVIIGWTGYDRSELVYNGSYYKFIPNTMLDWPLHVRDWYRAWVLCTDKDSSTNNMLLQYTMLASFLKYHKIKYYFFNSIISAEVPTNNFLHGILNNEPNQLAVEMLRNDQNFLDPFNPEMTFWHILKAKGYDGHKDGRWGHFTEDAHLDWANFLTLRIEDINPGIWT